MQKVEFKFLDMNEWTIVKIIRIEKQVRNRHIWADIIYVRNVTQYKKEKLPNGLFYNKEYPNDEFDDMVLNAVRSKYPNANVTNFAATTNTSIERLKHLYTGTFKDEAVIYFSPDLSAVDPYSLPMSATFTKFWVNIDIFTPFKDFLLYFQNEEYFDYYDLAKKDKVEKILQEAEFTVHHLSNLIGKTKRIGIIIQARLGSTRLPRKILKEFYRGKTLLETIISNLQNTGARIIVATSVNPNNDELVSFLNYHGIKVFRGSEDDVLSRFLGAAEANDIDGIVRICSDNPFLDWHGVAALIEKAKTSDADYIGYRINKTPSIKTHFGFWGEYVTLEALRRVAATTDEKMAHEHVTIHIYTHLDEYKCEWIECPDFLQGRNDIRLTVDNLEDFLNAQEVYKTLIKANPDFGLEDIVKYIDNHTELRDSMKQIIENNQK